MVLLRIANLKPHEMTQAGRLKKLKTRMRNAGIIRRPILVDAKTMVVLDGHHRLESLRALGCRFIPGRLIDYMAGNISVKSRRKGLLVAKEYVLNAGLTGELFPPRSSRHNYPKSPLANVPLDFLI